MLLFVVAVTTLCKGDVFTYVWECFLVWSLLLLVPRVYLVVWCNGDGGGGRGRERLSN